MALNVANAALTAAEAVARGVLSGAEAVAVTAADAVGCAVLWAAELRVDSHRLPTYWPALCCISLPPIKPCIFGPANTAVLVVAWLSLWQVLAAAQAAANAVLTGAQAATLEVANAAFYAAKGAVDGGGCFLRAPAVTSSLCSCPC